MWDVELAHLTDTVAKLPDPTAVAQALQDLAVVEGQLSGILDLRRGIEAEIAVGAWTLGFGGRGPQGGRGLYVLLPVGRPDAFRVPVSRVTTGADVLDLHAAIPDLLNALTDAATIQLRPAEETRHVDTRPVSA